MNVQESRSLFSLFLLDSVTGRSEQCRDTLIHCGFTCQLFQDWAELKDQAEINPPHMLLLHLGEPAWNIEAMITEAQDILPETHIFLLAPLKQMATAANFYKKGIYDIIPYPFENQLQLTRALDRAVELDYHIYRNEQDFDTKAMLSPFSLWLEELYHKKSVEESAEHFAHGVYNHLHQTACAYFKFFAPRRALIAAFGIGLEPVEVRGTGLNLNEVEEHFRVQDLREPEAIKAVRDMIDEVFTRASYFCRALEVHGRVLGIFVFFPPVENLQQNPWFLSAFAALEKNILLLETQKRLHSLGGRDEATETWNRQGFLQMLAEEIARARRTQLPISLLLIKVDQLTDIAESFGREESDLILRMIGKVFRKHSRINDIIGRVGPDELGMLLPHTGQKGAAIKAERLRRIIESADFRKVLKNAPKLNISVGISEYPSLCRDADELMQTADDALYEVCKQGGNLVCLSTRPEGFNADFNVPERSSP